MTGAVRGSLLLVLAPCAGGACACAGAGTGIWLIQTGLPRPPFPLPPAHVEHTCTCLHHRAASLARFEGKVFSLLYSKFQKVLMLDCDLVPLMDPDMLFNSPDFLATGNLFWPDIWQNWVSPDIYDIIGLTPDVMVGGGGGGGWWGQAWVPGRGRRCMAPWELLT